MSASGTKIFGMNLPVDPKILVLALIVVAGLIYYFTSGSETPGSGSSIASGSMASLRPAINPSMAAARAAAARRGHAARDAQRTLKLVPVDGSRGDVDPTLRLGVLERVKNVPPATGSRNLFDTSAEAVAQNLPQMPKNPPKIIPGPQPDNPAAVANNAPPPPPPFSIPLKYYGFVRPTGHALDGNRGFFLDGDNILVGGEGDVLEKRFLIVALTANSARLEDTQAKQGQDLPVTPEAPVSQ